MIAMFRIMVFVVLLLSGFTFVRHPNKTTDITGGVKMWVRASDSRAQDELPVRTVHTRSTCSPVCIT